MAATLESFRCMMCGHEFQEPVEKDQDKGIVDIFYQIDHLFSVALYLPIHNHVCGMWVFQSILHLVYYIVLYLFYDVKRKFIVQLYPNA